jgi:hypothetical protein
MRPAREVEVEFLVAAFDALPMARLAPWRG